MGFWTSQRIAKRLHDIIEIRDGNKPDSKNIDCNSYTLTIGDEIYVSPAEGEDNAPARAIRQLSERGSFSIPAGQFAFLTTEEIVKVPANAMAFISIKSTIKFQGLVNVSGFHVDPGFYGQLVFSVFNAGPRPIVLKRGQEAFLIWFADLSDNENGIDSDKCKNYESPNLGLSPSKLTQITGEVHSFQGILSRIKEGEKKASDRLNVLEREQAILKWAMMLIVGGVVGFVVKYILNGTH